MELGLEGKSAIVVGGSSNIGRAIVLGFAREDANVVVAARHLDDCERVVAAGAELGSGRLFAHSVDATRYEEVQELVARTLAEFGQIDILVGSIGWDAPGDFLEVDRSEWDEVIDSNYRYQLNCFHVVLPHMIAAGRGTIITVSSVMGRRGNPIEPVYCGTKAAQIVFSQAIARQMGEHGIRINVVAPGPTLPATFEELGGNSLHKRTWAPDDPAEFQAVRGALLTRASTLMTETPLGKFGAAEDVAAATLFLASEITAGHMTGQVLGVEGGLYMPH
jgi:NAD(P)-dependent dehydrogenase (short-subunit alcohol dehydrogenase family)